MTSIFEHPSISSLHCKGRGAWELPFSDTRASRVLDAFSDSIIITDKFRWSLKGSRKGSQSHFSSFFGSSRRHSTGLPNVSFWGGFCCPAIPLILEPCGTRRWTGVSCRQRLSNSGWWCTSKWVSVPWPRLPQPLWWPYKHLSPRVEAPAWHMDGAFYVLVWAVTEHSS